MCNKTLSNLAFILLIIPSNIFSQKDISKEKNIQKPEQECFYIKPDTSVNASNFSLPYATIILFDTRPDTTKLGYLYPKKSVTQTKICATGNTDKMITSFLSNHFIANFTETGDTVFAYLKKLWLSNDEISSTDFNFAMKAEFYLKTQSCFYPLYRFDTSLSVSGDLETTPGTLLKNALIASVRKLPVTGLYNFQNLRCISAQQIDSFNYPLRYIPIFRDYSMRKGVYLNFKQFRNNKPAYQDFKISADEMADILYVKGNILKDSAITDAWGFSDGDKIFIRRGNNFFPLHRTGDNFEFFAYKQISGKTLFPFDSRSSFADPMTAAIDVGIRGLLSKIRSRSKDLQIFQLDMETGRVY